MLRLDLPSQTERLLRQLALRAKQSPEEFARWVMIQRLEEMQDARIAEAALREFYESGEEAIPLSEVVKSLGLNDQVDGAEK